MGYEFHSNFPILDKEDVDDTGGPCDLNLPSKISFFAQALSIEEGWDNGRGHQENGKDYTRKVYRQQVFRFDKSQNPYKEFIGVMEKAMGDMGVYSPPSPDFNVLPPGTAFIQFQFTLRRPYISKDDQPFHICDNPVRKEKVFKVPMISATGWKGNLRWAATHNMVLEFHQHKDGDRFAKERMQLVRLFGDETGEDATQANGLSKYLDEICPEAVDPYRQTYLDVFGENGQVANHRGWLDFYSTYFDRIGLELINPHDRSKRSGIQPIYFECVPAGSIGWFYLLYTPFWDIGSVQKKLDIKLLIDTIILLMTVFGFSAKKSSGYGVAAKKISDAKLYTAKNPNGLDLGKNFEDMKNRVEHVQW